MFERYTEAARRGIFYSRYEAILTDSEFIEVTHLVLGILREDCERLSRCISLDTHRKLHSAFPVTRATMNPLLVRTPIQVNLRKKPWVPTWIFNVFVDFDIKADSESKDRKWLKRRLDSEDRLNRDIALSNESKRALAYAAEEAERLNHKHIGNLHLLLGILREETSAANKLKECGVELLALRKAAAKHA